MLDFRAIALCASLLAPAAAAQADWSQLTPPNLPPPLVGHALAFDLIRNQIVLFGGSLSGVGFTSDTWIYDGVTWTQVFPATVPPARAGHPMAYDLARQRVVMFGGVRSGGGEHGDHWEWDGSDWTQVFPTTVPPPRRSQPMIWHPIRQRIVMWGGYGSGADLNDTWEFDGTNWQQIVTANAPSPRRASDMAFDPNTGGIVLFSGYQSAADTWLFDFVDWRQVTPATTPPARYDHTMVHDLLRMRVVMFGGDSVGDTWEWDGSDWLQRTPATTPPARFDDYLIWDDLRQRVVMFGGLASTSDMWEYRTATPAEALSFGAGCNGTNGTAPSLGSTDRPWLGESFSMSVGSLPASGPVFVLTGVSNTAWNSVPLPLPLGFIGMRGCSMLIGPLVGVGVPNQGGSAQWSLALPAQSSLVGRSIYHQAAVGDPGANPLGITLSNGLQARFGMK